MFRLFILFNLLFLNTYACQGGYASCKQKLIDSNSIVGDILTIPSSQKHRIVFAKCTPKQKVIKYDPFLSLYLVEDEDGFKYPFKINMNRSPATAALNETTSIEGKIVKEQVGLNYFAKYSEPLFTPAVLTESCCDLEGIVTNKGIIQKEYLQRFLNNKEVSYSDIGVRVNDINNTVVVSSIDPFFKENRFKKGDCILEFDGKKVKSGSILMRDILFAKNCTLHNLKIKRGSSVLEFKTLTQKRYGGGFLSDTFLESKGIFFDDDLKVTEIQKELKNYGVKVGDRLLQVNKTDVYSQDDVRENISEFEEFSFLLFERDGFHFFVHLK